MPPNESRRWIILAALFLARTVVAVQFQSIGAVGPLAVQRLEIDYTTLGTLVGLFMLPGIVLALPGGLLGQRFGEKRIAVLGLVLMIAGGLGVAASSTVGVALAARTLSGIGGVLLNVVLTKMLIDWFAGREMALAMAIFVTSWPVGIGLTLFTLPLLAGDSALFIALLAPVALGVVALLAVSMFYQAPALLPKAGALLFRFGLSRNEWLLTIAAGLVWMFYNVGFIILMTFGPSFLAGRGVTLSQAGPIVSVAMWVCAGSVPLSGLVAQRFHFPNLLIAGGLATMAAATLLLAGGASPLVLYALFGLAAGVPAGLIMALPTEALTPPNRAAGMGVFYSVYYAGMAGLVPVAGWVRDASQDVQAPLYGAVGALVLAAVSLAAFRLLQNGTAATAAAAPGQSFDGAKNS